MARIPIDETPAVIRTGSTYALSRLVPNTTRAASNLWWPAAVRDNRPVNETDPPVIAKAIITKDPPFIPGVGYAIPWCVIRLRDHATVMPNTDTILLGNDLGARLNSLNLPAISPSTWDEVAGGYTYTDWRGQPRIVDGLLNAERSGSTTVGELLRAIFDIYQMTSYRPKPVVPESHNTEQTEDFNTDPSSRWTAEGGGYAWDSTNGEIDCNNRPGYNILRYSNASVGSLEHEQIGTFRVRASAGAGWEGPNGVRLESGTENGYNVDFQSENGPNGVVYINRVISTGNTILATYTNVYDVDPGNFISSRLAAEGTAGNTVNLSWWYVKEGNTKPASDPGWQGADGSPDETVNDEDSVNRHDESTHDQVGIICYEEAAWDDQQDYWRARAISDRAGGGGGATLRSHALGRGILSGAGKGIG